MPQSLRLAAAAALLLPVSAFAQSTRIDPALAQRLSLYDAGLPALPGEGLHSTGEQLDERLGLIVYTSDVAALRRSGVAVESTFDGFSVVRALPSQVEGLLATPGVSRVTLGAGSHVHNDVAASLVGARALQQGLLGDQAYTGAGAIVCVFDTGIDWKHLDFRSTTDTTKSRILRLYDMTLTATGGETPPQGLPTTYTTGVEYTQAQINDELDGTPTGFVRSSDTNGHGSHVSGTAAGNGGATGLHTGMAPDADIVFVRGGASSFSEANILNGIKYCDEVAAAAGKPMVMNMSLGSDDGSHDGQDSKSAAIAQVVQSKPGRVIVQSAGNSGGSNIHRGGTLAPGDSVELSFTVSAEGTAANAYFGVGIWSQGRNLTLIAVTPNGTRVQQLAGGDGNKTTTQGTPYLWNWLIDGTDRWDGDLDRELWFVSHATGSAPRTAAGTWKIRLRNDDTVADTWHAWMWDATIGATGTVTFVNADAQYTVSNASPEAISVGAYVHRWRWTNSAGSTYSYGTPDRSDLRASFSSQGPSRDGRALPHISAPGQNIISVRSSAAPASTPYDVSATHTGNQGTSMSAPVVTGSVALLLAANPSLTYSEVLTLLQDNATVDAAVVAAGAVPNNQFGAGKLNVYQAMARLVNPASTSTVRVLQYDNPSSGATLADVALTTGQNLLVKFQTAETGRFRGLNFHTGVGAPPSGGYDVRLWTNNGGVPGTQIGATVNLPASSMMSGSSWQYVSTDAITTPLTAATDYFVSLSPVGGSGSYRNDGATTGTHTFTAPEATPPSAQRGDEGTQDIGTMTAQSYNAMVRPVVSSDENAILPVELVTFDGAQSGRTAALTWMTASETNNAGWMVQQMGSGPDDWRDLGFVQGKGTTTEVQRYAFATETLLPGTYSFRLRQTDLDGTAHYSGLVMLEIGVDRALALLPAGPNPFAGRTALLLTVPQDGPATASLFDVLGRHVATLFDGAAVAGEAHTLLVDGAALAPGTYFVRAETAGRVVQRTLVVAR